MKRAVAYIRVSTAQQGKSGLGLEAQRVAIAKFAEAEGLADRRISGSRDRQRRGRFEQTSPARSGVVGSQAQRLRGRRRQTRSAVP
ncbi:recombinase family protein [Mesorhizobium sp. ISC25]|uniref:recombinase family protein n=1 Tax=Mesorhizobium sp. ISC25 TaxID=3077335 RepID=UPI0035D648C2